MIAHGGDKARIVEPVQELSFAHPATLHETDFNNVGREATDDIDLFDGANPGRIAAYRFRRVRLHGLRQHGYRHWLFGIFSLGMKRKRGRRKGDGGQYESVL